MRETRPFWLLLALITVFYSKTLSASIHTEDYAEQIQPIFDRYCVACHACFDAPCQLNLGSFEGAQRGATKALTYNGTRLKEVPTTRLFIDAHTTRAWRDMGFFPVLNGNNPAESLLLKFLQQKQNYSLKPGEDFPDDTEFGIDRDNSCPTPEQINKQFEKRPYTGMPFHFPGMDDNALQTITTWINAGAGGPIQAPAPHAVDTRNIEHWETWLNAKPFEQQLLSRWLFEHWYYAHLYFDNNSSKSFYRLVRSHTPPGQPVREIATRRPNDNPGEQFFYRFKRITDTRVYKTHITFQLNNRVRHRLNQTFTGYTVTRLPGYTEEEQANPFRTFAALPAKSRYQFMLDHAEYFVRTFIRGPVCRGQLATDVIRDHFWVLFQSPEKDPYINNMVFREDVTDLLALPNIEDDFLSGATQWFDAKFDRNDYIEKRQQATQSLFPGGVDLDLIWDGDKTKTGAMLTVFRHHDSATVKAGWLGQKPLTTWLLDFPLFEQSYYNLVVNFDVYGNLAHQAQTRLYFDFIRNGAEVNFLSLLPIAARGDVLKSWYKGSGKIKLWMSYEPLDMNTESQLKLPADSAYPDLLTLLLKRMANVNATPDPINRPSGLATAALTEEQLSQLAHRTPESLPVVSHMPDASLLLVPSAKGSTEVYTIIRNRRHSNVAFILGEDLRYEPELDQLSLVKGIATSYPNMLFYVPESALGQFIQDFQNSALKDEKVYRRQFLPRWAVSRRQPDFWEKFHLTTHYLYKTAPVEAGILDLNRYLDY